MARAAFSLIFNFGRLHNYVSVMGQALNYLVFVSLGDRAHGTALPCVGIVGPVTVVAQAQTGAQFSQQICTLVGNRLGKNDITVHSAHPFLMSSKATRISVIAAVFSFTTVLHWYHISKNAAIGKPTLEIACKTVLASILCTSKINMSRIKSPVLALADACPPLLGAAFGHRGLISLYAIAGKNQVFLQYSRKNISSE
nr:MAG TPA: hypothetical protein [Caudoviricetes sp.]